MKKYVLLLLLLFPAIAMADQTSICVQTQSTTPGQSGQNCYPVAPGSPLPTGGSLATAVTNSSSTITTGGTFQTVAATNNKRQSLDFINICNVTGNCTATTDICYLYFGVLASATTTNSVPIAAGYEYLRSSGTIPSAPINVTCTSTGDKFYLQVQ